MINDQLIYVAHPFGGNKANKYSIDTIMENSTEVPQKLENRTAI